jgi:hypothetical protein
MREYRVSILSSVEGCDSSTLTSSTCHSRACGNPGDLSPFSRPEARSTPYRPSALSPQPLSGFLVFLVFAIEAPSLFAFYAMIFF